MLHHITVAMQLCSYAITRTREHATMPCTLSTFTQHSTLKHREESATDDRQPHKRQQYLAQVTQGELGSAMAPVQGPGCHCPVTN